MIHRSHACRGIARQICRAALAVFLLGGCLPAGVFTTARTLEPGQIEHVAFLDVPVSHYENPRGPRQPGDPPDSSPITRDTGGPQVGYALRAGIAQHIELGAGVSTSAGELNAKIGILDAGSLALALAPRFASTWSTFSGEVTPLYHARLPLLFTVEANDWFSVTPRAGLGVARGRVGGLSTWGPLENAGGHSYVSEPIVEAGLTLMFGVGRRLALAVEGYGLTSVNDASSRREVTSVGGGLALIIGRRERSSRSTP